MLRIIFCASIVVTAIAAAVVCAIGYSAVQGEQRSLADGLLIVSAVVVLGSLVMAAVIFRALRPHA
jgi:hypothetical protein